MLLSVFFLNIIFFLLFLDPRALKLEKIIAIYKKIAIFEMIIASDLF